jgi:tetratricopeptide (TPR) repeat protein
MTYPRLARLPRFALTVFALVVLGGPVARARPAVQRDEVPITTASDEARALYLQGRDLNEKLRLTDAHGLFERAVRKDPDFALAYLGLAAVAPTTQAYFAALDHAVALAEKVSAPERLMIRGLHAGATGKPTLQQALYTQLVRLYPKDARALSLLGAFYFGQQDYARSIELYTRAIAINPRFGSPYNILGYAYRAVENYAASEKMFKKYIELIPDDPNPYDSYAELLMKTGQLDASIRSYEQALTLDRTFVSAYVGIANDQMFSGRGADARATLAKLFQIARNDGERRQALEWTAVSFIHEQAWDRALGEVDKIVALAERAQDLAQQANALGFKANVLLEAGRADEAAATIEAQLEVSDRASLPADVKEAAHRNALFDETRVALAQLDLTTARARAAAYARQVAAKQVPIELRQQHELAGRIALAESRPRLAVAELAQANQRDPRVLFLSAVALRAAGEPQQARAAARKVAELNILSLHYGYVRGKAQALVGS